MITMLLIGLIAAVGNRIRGGLFGDRIRQVIPWYGTTVARISYGVVLGLSALVVSGDYYLAAAIVPTIWFGLAIAPFAPWQFMQKLNDIFIMSLRGIILVGTTSIVIGSLHDHTAGFLYLIVGLLMGPVYYISTKLPAVTLFHEDPSNTDTNATAEVVFGLIQGVALVLLLS